MNICDVLKILSYLVLCHHLTDGIEYSFTGDPLYVGCYTNFEAKTQTTTTNTIKECLTLCSRQSHVFGAFKSTSGCYCGDTIYLRVPSGNCNRVCAGNDGICGGNDHFAVYAAVPTYLGCFIDSLDRDLNTYLEQVKKITVQTCFQKCHFKGVRYASAQSDHCLCGKTYGKYGKVFDLECDMACTGDTGLICGSDWRNSVYSANHVPGLNLDFVNVFHCAEGSDAFGVCTNGECLPGWKGNKCNQRDCAVLNGNCDVCAEYKTGNHAVSECLCVLGFESTSIYHECKAFPNYDKDVSMDSNEVLFDGSTHKM